MLKFTSKRDVDRHVSQMTKNLSESERSSRGYAIAKSYVKVSEFELARDWLQRYLDIRTEDAAAHKLMGEIYEHLKKPEQAITSLQRSYGINSKQNDLIKNICRLFLVNNGWSSSPGKAKYWCELAENENVRDDNVLSLRLQMLNKDKKNGGKPVEEMILKEIAGRPHDIGLRIRLVNFLLDEKRIAEAFKYCFDLEMKFMEIFLLSIDWYATVSSVLAQQTSTDSFNYWCLLLISMDKKIFLTLKRDLPLQSIKQSTIKDITNMIFDFDQILKKAADALSSLVQIKDVADELINHFRGQLSLNIASLMFQKQNVSNNDQWRETTKKCLPFLLFAFQSSTVNTEAFWMKNNNETIRHLFIHLKREGSFRCAQAGRTIIACKSTGSEELSMNIRNFKSMTSIEDIFNHVREVCADLNWRKNIYRYLFANADQQTKISTSYFVQNSYFQEPSYELLSFNDIEMYEDVAQHLYPSSLEHHVYLGLGRKDLFNYKSYTFNGLNLSTPNLINCSPETINRIDIDSFLYCSIIQAKRRLEAEKDCYETFNNKPNEKPLILPAANMIEGLCSEEQNEWWLSAFKIYKNITGENLAQLKATLQFGIEAVRGIDTPKVDVIILLKLGDILLGRANSSEKSDERRHCELRVEFVYKIALRMMRSSEGDNMRRLFKFLTTNFDVDREIEQLSGIAIGHLSSIYFKREEYKEFIEDFTGLQNPWAFYFLAEAYRRLEDSNKTPRKNKKLYAEKARENLIETLVHLDNNATAEKTNPLRMRVEKELKKMEYNYHMTTPFNNDFDLHNSSQNGNVDDEMFHNASATSFRGRRSEVPTINYNEKFSDIETMMKKLTDLVMSVKDDILCVRNDISELREEVMNCRGDVADANVNSNAVTTKSFADVKKTIDDLNCSVVYMMDLMSPATAAAAVLQPHQTPSAQRYPSSQTILQQQYNQMLNTAYSMYPTMQYPTPNMHQPSPIVHPKIPAYDALGQNLIMNPMTMPNVIGGQQPKPTSLIDALNTPSVLSTWNNTWNNTNNPTVPSTPATNFQTPPPSVATSVIQNKVVEKAPPINVVITNSDPLPPQNSFISQPMLSVKIPPQHIKHAPHPTTKTTPVATNVVSAPQYENISPVKNTDTSEYLEEPADYDPRPDFVPIIPLPEEVEVKTHEENEDVLFTSDRCKLFRHFEKEWKERGIGIVKILKNKDTGKHRILMRRDQIHKVCANHVITSEMELKPMKETQFMWGANDYSDGQMQLEQFLIRFKTAENAKRFKDAFEDAKKMTPKDVIQEKSKEALKVQDTNEKVKQPSFNSPAINSTFTFGGAQKQPISTTFSSTPTKNISDATKNSTQPSPFANFTFGQGSTNKSFSELFGSISTTPKSDLSSSTSLFAPQTEQPAAVSTLNKSNEEDVDHYEPTAQFEPVIPLPDLVDMKTGEEDENVKFTHRGKLLRYDTSLKEWKERGIGEMKVLVNKENQSKARLLMRREQVLKLCCNMIITKDLKFMKMNATTYSFGGQDFSENEMMTEKFAIKFKTSEIVEKFLESVRDVQKNLDGVKVTTEKKETEKKTEVKGFGDQFKAKAGSWSCEACYITNKPETLYCVACESPKDNTVPKKEAKSVLASSADAPKFSFGMPTASGFSFGMPAAVTTTSATTSQQQQPISFGFSSPATTTASQNAADSTSSNNFPLDALKSFSFGVPKPDSTSAVVDTSTSSPSLSNHPSFNFVFKSKSPVKSKSPGKSRNDSVNSGGGDDEDGDDYHEEENQTYFTPVIPLPEKVEIVTGEENEEVLYCHRAKLYRFSQDTADKEWKERGLGDIKILKHKETGKLRVVMRREQIFKICLNFFLTDEIELKRKNDNSWSFGANDFSEGEFEPTLFAIRFKTKEIAEEFRKAIDDALASSTTDMGEKQDGEADEKSELVKKLMLPEGFFDYINAQDCPGCIGCNPDDYTSPKTSENVNSLSEISLQSPSIKPNPKPRRQSVDKHVSFKIDEENSNDSKPMMGSGNVKEIASLFGGIKKSEGSTNIFATFNAENPPSQTSTLFGTSSVFGTTNSFPSTTNSIFSSSLNTTPATPTADTSITFGTKTTETFSGSGLFGNKTNFTFGSGDKTNNIFNSGMNKENGVETAFSNTPTFASISSDNKVNTEPTGNIFGSEFKSSFSFADAAKELESNKTNDAVVPDFIQKNSDGGGFAALAAAATNNQGWGSANNSPAGGFYGLTVKEDFFSKNLNNSGTAADSGNNDGNDTNDDNYDPHYDPIIQLPDEINVSTGEEEEEKLFGERAKLFRYDSKEKEWKERGVGEIKILHHGANGTYRLLQRREQIFKLVLNQLITNDFLMTPFNNSPKAFLWAGMNYAESSSGETEQLAIRFKNEDIANAFKAKVDEYTREIDEEIIEMKVPRAIIRVTSIDRTSPIGKITIRQSIDNPTKQMNFEIAERGRSEEKHVEMSPPAILHSYEISEENDEEAIDNGLDPIGIELISSSNIDSSREYSEKFDENVDSPKPIREMRNLRKSTNDSRILSDYLNTTNESRSRSRNRSKTKEREETLPPNEESELLEDSLKNKKLTSVPVVDENSSIADEPEEEDTSTRDSRNEDHYHSDATNQMEPPTANRRKSLSRSRGRTVNATRGRKKSIARLMNDELSMMSDKEEPQLEEDDDDDDQISENSFTTIRSIEGRTVNPPPKPGWDSFCFKCHTDMRMLTLACSKCKCSYHRHCVRPNPIPKNADEFICPECREIEVAESSNVNKCGHERIDTNTLADMLAIILEEIRLLPGREHFENDVVVKTSKDTNQQLIVTPISLKIIDTRIKNHYYKTTEVFIHDFKQLEHNWNIVDRSKSKILKNIVKNVSSEIYELEACVFCYEQSFVKTDWFVQPCKRTHLLIWAKLKGYPYWPAKVMSVDNRQQVDVRFFGAHDRAWVPAAHCMLISEKDPNKTKGSTPTNAKNASKPQKGILDAMKEKDIYIENLREKYGFRYSPFRQQFDPNNLQGQLNFMLPGLNGQKTEREISDGVQTKKLTLKIIKNQSCDYQVELKPGELRQSAQSNKTPPAKDRPKFYKILSQNDDNTDIEASGKLQKMIIKRKSNVEQDDEKAKRPKIVTDNTTESSENNSNVMSGKLAKRKVPHELSKHKNSSKTDEKEISHSEVPQKKTKQKISTTDDSQKLSDNSTVQRATRRSRLKSLFPKADEPLLVPVPTTLITTNEAQTVREKNENHSTKEQSQSKSRKLNRAKSTGGEKAKETETPLRLSISVPVPEKKAESIKKRRDASTHEKPTTTPTAEKPSDEVLYDPNLVIKDEPISDHEVREEILKNSLRISDIPNLTQDKSGKKKVIVITTNSERIDNNLPSSSQSGRARKTFPNNFNLRQAEQGAQNGDGWMVSIPQTVTSTNGPSNASNMPSPSSSNRSTPATDSHVSISQLRSGTSRTNSNNSNSNRSFIPNFVSAIPHHIDNMNNRQSSTQMNSPNLVNGQRLSMNNNNQQRMDLPRLAPLGRGSVLSSEGNHFHRDIGPISRMFTDNAHRVTDFFRNVLVDTVTSFAPEIPAAENLMLRKEIEKLQFEMATLKSEFQYKMQEIRREHQEEIETIKKTYDDRVTSLQLTMEQEKIRLVNDIRHQCENEKQRAIEITRKETKKTTWCSNCTKEARFYCCWNTSYCGQQCQKTHWQLHQKYCTNKNSANDTQNNKQGNAEVSTSIATTTANISRSQFVLRAPQPIQQLDAQLVPPESIQQIILPSGTVSTPVSNIVSSIPTPTSQPIILSTTYQNKNHAIRAIFHEHAMRDSLPSGLVVKAFTRHENASKDNNVDDVMMGGRVNTGISTTSSE
ncbi:CLUMA_CG012135, isoform A [Clunio marinus]|uniref:CLUMA_CG012135, isoform A n=1 Tax=Clunio marinus TaxID=568069 RepID=A0A1J1IEH0_9DIPT|nr:CLUMA_CG012135, isoform A [Clunio marinus]